MAKVWPLNFNHVFINSCWYFFQLVFFCLTTPEIESCVNYRLENVKVSWNTIRIFEISTRMKIWETQSATSIGYCQLLNDFILYKFNYFSNFWTHWLGLFINIETRYCPKEQIGCIFSWWSYLLGKLILTGEKVSLDYNDSSNKYQG